MKIAIIGDIHFGFQWGTERSNDSFLQAKDALEKACKDDVDLILQLGDLFDSRVPKPEVISNAMQVFLKPITCKKSTVKIVDTVDKNITDFSKRSLQGIPVIAIHGTHDRRSRGLVNPVEVMEKSGFLIHIDKGTIIFEKDNERVAVHGFSGIPERYAGNNFKKWDPIPIKNAKNIMLLHQSFSEYIYSPLEPPTMNTKMLPDGFDLFINGHIHWSDVKDLKEKGIFLLSGSTIVTQITKPDTERPKYIWFYDTETKQLTKEEIDQARKIFLEEINITNLTSTEIRDKLLSLIESLPTDKEKPLLKIKLTGRPSKGIDVSKVSDLSEFSSKFLIKIDKKFDNEISLEKIKSIKEALGKKLSPDQMGLDILIDELEDKTDFDVESLFKLLVDGNVEEAYNKISGDSTHD